MSAITQVHSTTPEELINEIDKRNEIRFNNLEKKFFLREAHPKWITRQEVSKLLSVSLVTLNYWNKKGILPCHKIGNRVRYSMTDIDKALIKIK